MNANPKSINCIRFANKDSAINWVVSYSNFLRVFITAPEKLNLKIESLNPNFKTAVEFRHQSWWSKDVYDQLAKNNIIFCSGSHPTMPSDIIANTFVGCLRLHGNPKMFYSEYSHTDLMNLHETIVNKHLFEEVFIYFNNTASAAGVLNALELRRLFKS